MSFATRLMVIGIVLTAAVLAGAVWLILRGRVHQSNSAEQIDLSTLGLPTGSFRGLGESATLLLFSTEFCATCPGVERAYLELLATRPWAKLIKIDLTNRNDLAVRFHVLQTPTTFVLNSHSNLVARIGGAPKLLALTKLLDDLAVGASHSYAI